MVGLPVTSATTLVCAHGGAGRPTLVSPRVRLSGRPVVLLDTTVTVTACPNPPPPNGTGPCLTARFPAGSIRVRASGRLLVLQHIPGVCVPTGVPLTAATTTDPRVRVV